MLVHLRSDLFSNHFLRFVDQDPVHSLTDQRLLERRCKFDRNIFFWVENDVPVAILCVAYTHGLPDNVSSILDNDSPVSLIANHAIFYSVFKTNEIGTTPNVGATLIRAASIWIRDNLGQIQNFVTMSPIPNLSAHFAVPPSIDAIVEFLRAQSDPVARFHLRNGAKVLRAIHNADTSEKRKEQSYGSMANYDYTSSLIAAPSINTQ